MSDDDELPSDVRAMLHTERSFVDMPAAARTRLARRLGYSAAAAVSAAALKRAAFWKGLVFKGTFITLMGAGALALHEATRSAPVVTTAVTQTSRVALPPIVSAPTAPLEAHVDEPAPVVVATRAVPIATPPSPAAVLAEEQRLLESARSAIAVGDPASALDALTRHERRFPQGTLTEERFALRIRALAKLDRKDEARVLLEQMRARFPRSFLLDGAARDIEAIP